MSSLRSAWHTRGELDQPAQPGNTLSQTKILKRDSVTHREKNWVSRSGQAGLTLKQCPCPRLLSARTCKYEPVHPTIFIFLT